MKTPLFLPCAAGVEPLLLEETLNLLPDCEARAQRGGVALVGGLREMMVINLESRLAQRVLWQLAHGTYRHENEVYALARGVDWTPWISPDQTLRVDCTAQRSPLQSLHFATLRVKDAVCDHWLDHCSKRPSVDMRNPHLSLLLHLNEDQAWLYIDTSGEPLFKRGWREDKGDAPLKETLAAAMLAAAHWDGTAQSGALSDPCCGSGTIVIEAAQIACKRAPGLQRRFGFERLAPFIDGQGTKLWQTLKNQARARIQMAAVPIFASDVSFRMVDFARRNAQRAGVSESIEFHGGDALERPAPELPEDLPGVVMINPPYGERIEVSGKSARAASPDRDAEPDFFPRLATHWKRNYTAHAAGWTAYVLSPDMKLPGQMRLKEAKRTPLWNGPIECRLFRFDLVAGRMRPAEAAAPVDDLGARALEPDA
jgi:putative N6-adenine-specific DNA methylase